MEITQLNQKNHGEFLDLLKSCSDEKYKVFNSRVIPGIGESLGIRSPELKKVAKELKKHPDLQSVVGLLHKGSLYEEKALEGSVIPYLPYENVEQMFEQIGAYIGRIDNWALCDGFVVALRPLVKKHPELFYERAKRYTASDNPWEKRLGLILMNGYFNSAGYLDEIFGIIEAIDTDHYYVNMGIAWLVSTLYLSDREKVSRFLEKTSMNSWCVNKAIQKITESLRVSEEEKKTVRALKR